MRQTTFVSKSLQGVDEFVSSFLLSILLGSMRDCYGGTARERKMPLGKMVWFPQRPMVFTLYTSKFNNWVLWRIMVGDLRWLNYPVKKATLWRLGLRYRRDLL